MKGIIGQPFTFTALFLDATNSPVNPLDATIEVFYYSDVGVKVYIVPIGTSMTASLPPEVGRFFHNFTIPGSLEIRNVLYGVMRGTDPFTTDLLVIEQEVSLFTVDNGTGGNSSGLTASTFKAGQC